MKPIKNIIFSVLACFALFHFDVMAYALGDCSDKDVPAGKMCITQAVAGHQNAYEIIDCKFGCYCVGAKNKIGVSSSIEHFCAKRYIMANEPDNAFSAQGIYRCPDGKKSVPGAKSVEDCYSILTANDGSKNCVLSPNEGHYCKKKNNKRSCEPGCYCTGGNINAVGENNSNNPYGQVVSNCKDKKEWAKDYLNLRGIFYCPDGYTSKSGAKSITECFDNNGNYYVVPATSNTSPRPKPNVATLQVVPNGSSCPVGYYMPTSCIPCTGNTIVNATGDGCSVCESGTQPNTEHTACVGVINSSISSKVKLH
jgi:hypothetical protein